MGLLIAFLFPTLVISVDGLMAAVFISYRKSDSIWPSAVLLPRLQARFGEELVFRDAESIAPGSDWEAAIYENLENCEVFVLVVGSNWLNARDEKGLLRLGSDNDIHTKEIEFALNQTRIRVLPVFLDDIDGLDKSRLPASLKALGSLQGIKVDAKYEPEAGFLKLENAVEKDLVAKGLVQPNSSQSGRKSGLQKAVVFVICVAVCIPLLVMIAASENEGVRPNNATVTSERDVMAKPQGGSLEELQEAFKSRGITPARSTILEETTVPSLGKPDYSNFDIHYDKRIWSFVHYAPNRISEGSYKSATVTLRTVVVSKNAMVDELRFEQRTQGSDIVFNPIGIASKVRVESTRSLTYSGKYRTRVKHLCIDVSGYDVGQEFFISYAATNWDADDRDDPWFGAITYPGCKQLKILALSTTPGFFADLKVSKSDNFKSDDVPTDEGSALRTADDSALLWRIENPEAEKIYIFRY